MRKLSALMLVAAGFSQWSCGDDNPGPPLGPETSWQFNCAVGSTDCGSIVTDPHGPVEGTDMDTSKDDEKITVSCTKSSSGLEIILTDPGRALADPDDPRAIPARSGSQLKITKAVPGSNKCFVSLNETLRGGTNYRLTDSCVNTEGDPDMPGSCTLTGSMNQNGYAFDGTLVCPKMYQANTTVSDYRLGAGRAVGDPIHLQIVHCH